jgi:hypothetical protein
LKVESFGGGKGFIAEKEGRRRRGRREDGEAEGEEQSGEERKAA